MAQNRSEAEVLQDKVKRRLMLREEFLKQATNPHRHASGEGGVVFDPAMSRFQAMRVSNYEHFKPTARAFRTGAFTVVIPIVLYAWALKSERDGREAKYRTGQVAYKDRLFKFI